MTREWNAASYHRVSNPQFAWGLAVLGRLALRGDERVIDAGCGSGRLTGALAGRLPHGRVLAVDRSRNMLEQARSHLAPFGARVRFAQAALPPLPVAGWADVVFSTATFHWVLDHPRLFAHLASALRPGGRLHAQCGGGPNLAGAYALAAAVMALPAFAGYFRDWPPVWEFADAATTRARLEAAGFVDVETATEPAPVTFDDADAYREFVTTVIYHPQLARLPEPLRQPFVDEVTARAAATATPFTLDYWRLNMAGRRR
jgi:trans-aconitate 2-methyltransferase